jgi:hypothetical protein
VPAPGGLTVLDATPTAGLSAPLAHVSTPGIPVFDLGVPLGRRPGLRHSIEHDVVLGARKRYVEGQAVGTVPRSRCWAGATLTAWPSAQRHVSISGSLRYGYTDGLAVGTFATLTVFLQGVGFQAMCRRPR